MAILQQRNGSYRVQFFHHGKIHNFTVGKVTPAEADAKVAQVDYLLMRLKQKLVALPAGTDIVTFVKHDGKPPGALPVLPEAKRTAVTLGHLRDRYLETHGNGTLEANTLYTCKIHFAHFARVFGAGQPVGEIDLGRLQEYITTRAKAVSPVTIRKELSTLRAAWNWGELAGLTAGKFPNKGLRYPKTAEKPPFMTREEAERQIAAGGDAAAVWDALCLKTDEVAELLAFVKGKDTQPFVYPLFCFAAHTGARRSEIIRVTTADVDFAANTVTLREKKKSQGQETCRRVPLSPLLRGVLGEWLAAHLGGPALFCHAGEVDKSSKRSRTTGHRGEKSRPTGGKARLANVRKRGAQPAAPLTRNEVHHFFKSALKESKWDVLRGLHALRHSFVSACATKGMDQRLVESFAGHMSADMSRRYAHLYPSVRQDAINAVFG